MSGYLYDDAPTQLRTRATYEVGLIRKLPALASRALGNMEAVRFATASREVCIGTNRRELDDEGDIIGGENPTGPVDHEVRVIRFDDLLGKPTPVVFAHGCHTVTMGPNYLTLMVGASTTPPL